MLLCHHTTQSVCGEAERAVQTAKHILTTPDPYLALLAYHATKHSTTGFSPPQLSMGRPLRTTIPTIKFNLQAKGDEKAKQTYKSYYDNHHGTRPLPELFPADKVNIKQDVEKKGVVPGIVEGKAAETPQSYIVKTSKESLQRNSKHLQIVPDDPGSHDQQAGEEQSLSLEAVHDIGTVSPKNDVPGSVPSRYGCVIKLVVKMNL